MAIFATRSRSDRERFKALALGVSLFLVLVTVFSFSPWQPGDDWENFAAAARRVLNGSPLYSEIILHYYYDYPPWLAVLSVPIGLLPFRIGLAVISALTLVAPLLLLRRWQPNPGLIKPFLALLSPPVLYILIHGQVDAVILLGVFLPVELWWLVALTKPQVSLGLAAGVPLKRWLYAGLVTAVVLAASLLIFGNWPKQILLHPQPFINQGHNVWLGLWPYQVPVGIALLTLGISRRDERLLVASSPLLAPYAAISSFLGAWIAVLTFLKNWQAFLVWLGWWAAIAYRALVS